MSICSFKGASLAALLLAATLVCGCERIAPIRTLPSWVRGIYIPMFHNESYEPAIEELATQLTQESFISDGQVDVVRKEDADATLLVTLMNWTDEASGTSGDRITENRTVFLEAKLRLVAPYDEKDVIADLGIVRVFQPFRSDTRSIKYEPEPDRRQALMQQLGYMIVGRTITGFPVKVGPYGGTEDIQPTDVRDVQILDPMKPRKGTVGY